MNVQGRRQGFKEEILVCDLVVLSLKLVLLFKHPPLTLSLLYTNKVITNRSLDLLFSKD